MMDIIEAVDIKIHTTETLISEEAAALDGEDDAEHSMLLRARIQAMSVVLKQLKGARANLAPAVFAFLELEPKFLKWRALCATAREAQERMGKCAKVLLAARAALPELENLVARAEYALVEHKKYAATLEGPGAYRSGHEVRAVKDEGAKLEAKYAQAIERRRDAKLREGQAHKKWFDAAKQLDQAAFTERMARLPAIAEKEYHSVSLNGVESGGVTSVG
jgi:hypothetical protein